MSFLQSEGFLQAGHLQLALHNTYLVRQLCLFVSFRALTPILDEGQE